MGLNVSAPQFFSLFEVFLRLYGEDERSRDVRINAFHLLKYRFIGRRKYNLSVPILNSVHHVRRQAEFLEIKVEPDSRWKDFENAGERRNPVPRFMDVEIRQLIRREFI